ncbi:MAG TPA: tetratricopeptide repeat protein [Bacteroidia bacterium]|jgi:tetratricopeptide (TPR) repeat protein
MKDHSRSIPLAFYGKLRTAVLLITVIIALPLFMVCCGGGGKTNNVGRDSLPADLKAIDEQIDRDPKNAALYVKRAEYFFLKKKMDSVVNDMTRAIDLDPNNAGYHMKLSDYYFMMNRTRGTRNELIQATKVDPKNTEAFLKLGELYYLVKNYDSAVYYINRSISVDPENPKAYFQKGVALEETGDSANAVAAYQSAVERDPKYYDAFIRLGKIYGAHRDALAVQYLDNALQLNPNSGEAYYFLGLYYQNIKDVKNAVETYNKLLQQTPNDRHAKYAVYNIGFVKLILENNPKDAKGYFDKSFNMDPGYADAIYMRGVCYEKMGDKKNAAADFNAAIVIDPEHQLALNGLRRLSGKK